MMVNMRPEFAKALKTTQLLDVSNGSTSNLTQLGKGKSTSALRENAKKRRSKAECEADREAAKNRDNDFEQLKSAVERLKAKTMA